MILLYIHSAFIQHPHGVDFILIIFVRAVGDESSWRDEGHHIYMFMYMLFFFTSRISTYMVQRCQLPPNPPTNSHGPDKYTLRFGVILRVAVFWSGRGVGLGWLRVRLGLIAVALVGLLA